MDGSYSPDNFSTSPGFNSHVDPRLLDILQTAAAQTGMTVQAYSGMRPGDPRFHGRGMATDIRLFDQDNKPIPNYQDARNFRTYEQFAQAARQVQQEKYPDLSDAFRWGGYFSGGKGKYGALDLMHFDLGGERVGMAGGSWEHGLTPQQAKLWGIGNSVGMSQGGQAMAYASQSNPAHAAVDRLIAGHQSAEAQPLSSRPAAAPITAALDNMLARHSVLASQATTDEDVLPTVAEPQQSAAAPQIAPAPQTTAVAPQEAAGAPAWAQPSQTTPAPQQAAPGPSNDVPAWAAPQQAAPTAAPPQSPQAAVPEGFDTTLGAQTAAMGHALFNIPNILTAGIGQGLHALGMPVGSDTYQHELQRLNAEDAALAAKHPTATTVGTVGGLAAGLGAGPADLATMAPRAAAAAAPRAAPTLAKTMLGNAAVGATLGGIGGAGETGTVEGGIKGAVAGGVLGALAAPTVRAGAAILQRVLPAGRIELALKRYADALPLPGESAADAYARVRQAWENFRTTFGRNPSMAEIGGELTAQRTAAMLRESQAATTRMQGLEREAAERRQTQVSDAIQRGGTPARASTLSEDAANTMTAEMDAPGASGLPVRETPVPTRRVPGAAATDLNPLFEGENYDLINRALGRTSQDARALEMALEQGAPVPLRLIDLARRNVERAAAVGDAELARHVGAGLLQLGRDTSPEYAAIYDRYANTMRRAAGAEVGAKGVSQGPLDFEAAQSSLARESGARELPARGGVGPGMRTELAQTARQSIPAAAQTARQVSENAALGENMASVLGAPEAQRIGNVGQQATNAARSFATATPAIGKTPNDAEMAAAHAVIGLTHPTSYLAHRLAAPALRFIHGMPQGTLLRLAELAGDPRSLPAVMNYLMRSRRFSRTDAQQFVTNAATLLAARGASQTAVSQ